MAYVLQTSAPADEHARKIDTWWRMNRAAAPDLFLKELGQAYEILAAMPSLGTTYRGLRRVLLRQTRHHVYYAVDDESRTVVIRGIWHAVRRRVPSR
jgi:plasmid stabilization system protein ParE